MLKNKILVIVENGQIQDIYTQGETEVFIADYDNVDPDSKEAKKLECKVAEKISSNSLFAINSNTGWNYLNNDLINYQKRG